MIQDLHSHTYYSFCGGDKPEQIVEAAIAGGIELFGITDHHYGIGNARTNVFSYSGEEIPEDYERTLVRYYDHMNLIKEKYANQIRILRGIEVATVRQGRIALPEGADISFFDYCLVEHLDQVEHSIANGDLFSFAKRCGCPVGIAHTDMFAFIDRLGEKPEEYFKQMAKEHIFWEMNVSYDSIHNYREHPYVLRFFEDEKQQEIVRNSGVRLSVGFDGHRVEDYLPERVASYCKKLTDMGIKLAFED
ncbi:MAG: PHP domain-containing protein [Faecalimonas sp.]|nr:PHP domain-containing protein [Faecalimonas sp.]